ncbi:MAG TPA: D-2-hydroxyacid dehydrogenase [Chryseosolibacter sp.]
MKIVITDGFTLNPGDLSWKPFYSLGDVDYHDRTSPAETVIMVRDADVIVTNKTPITADVIQECKNLKLIAVTATGYNVIDVDAAKKHRVLVCNVPEYGTFSVAQHAISLIVELSNRVGTNSQSVRGGDWSSSTDWCYSRSPIIELKDKTLGIVGLGRIGNQTARVASALGMKIAYQRGKPDGVEAREVTLDELFRESDFVSLHCPLRADNEKFVNSGLLSLMKSTAFLINTSRGQLIDEVALAGALQKNQIAGAALDVLSKEPPPSDHPLLLLANCIITPHTAWLSREARARILQTTYENIRMAMAGQAQNLVG